MGRSMVYIDFAVQPTIDGRDAQSFKETNNDAWVMERAQHFRSQWHSTGLEPKRPTRHHARHARHS